LLSSQWLGLTRIENICPYIFLNMTTSASVRVLCILLTVLGNCFTMRKEEEEERDERERERYKKGPSLLTARY